ncbi:MAG: PKD domain-containing protein [Bacteroidales bacterium]|nr:PKD domain-containing protein [Bacteroidales bacterium]
MKYFTIKYRNFLFILITFNFSLFTFHCSAQHWVPDTNKKFSFDAPTSQFLAGTGNKLYVAKDTLYISGNFGTIGNIRAYCIARYSNGRWDSLRGGIYGVVNAMQYVNGYLYVGGFFQYAIQQGAYLPTPYYPPNMIDFMNIIRVPHTTGTAKWDGNQWYSIDTTVDCAYSCIYDLLYFNNKFYFAGSNLFGMAWGMISFDGTTWGDKCITSGFTTLHTYHQDLLAGDASWGLFFRYLGNTQFDSVPYGGIYGGPYCMLTDTINDFLYLAGYFWWVYRPKPIESHWIAMYDGYEWHSMGTNNFHPILDMKIYRGYLYAGGGSYVLEDSITRINNIARWDWDNFHWFPLDSGVTGGMGGVGSMEIFHDTLFVTGGFTIAGGDSAIGLARWYAPPDTCCAFLRPMIHTLNLQDTFYLSQGQVAVQFFNNNAYAESWQWDFGDGTEDVTNTYKDPLHTYTHAGVYQVNVAVTHKMLDDTTRTCTKTATKRIVVLQSSEMEAYNEESLHFIIYPNPTTGDFTVECTLPANKTGLIKTYNSYGSYLREFPLETGCNHIVIPAGQWFTNVILCGLYIDGKQVLVKKVVKSK